MNFKNILLFSLGPVSSTLLGFISLPMIAWYFSPDAIGKVSMLQITISMCLIIFSFGTDHAFIRFFHEETYKAKLFYSSIIPLTVMVIIFIIVVCFVGLDRLTLFLYDDVNFEVGVMTVVTVTLFSFNRYLSVILRMENKAFLFSFSQIFNKITYLLSIVIVISVIKNYEYIYLISSLFMANLAVFIYLLFVNSKFMNPVESFCLNEILNQSKTLILFGYPLMFGAFAYWGLTSVDRVFLKYYSNYYQIGLFSVSSSFAAAAMILQNVFSTIWAPNIYKNADLQPELKVAKAGSVLLKIICCLLGLSGLLSWCVTYMLPSEYNEVRYIVLSSMIFPLYYILSEVYVVGLGLIKKTKYIFLASLLSFLINCIFNYLLIPSFGASGAAASTAISFWFFFIFRAEFTSRLWYKFDLKKIYIVTFIYLVASVTFTLYGSEYNNYFIFVWMVLFISPLYSSKNLVVKLYERKKAL